MITKLMRRLAMLVSLLVVLSAALFANTGDVSIKIRDSHGVRSDTIRAGTNYLEFWLTNDVPIGGMSLGFSVDFAIPSFRWVKPYGNRPVMPGAIIPCIQEYGDAIGAFDLGYLKFTDKRNNVSPDTFLFGGATSGTPLPAHAVSTMLYDLAFTVSSCIILEPQQDGLCISPAFIPPAGTWTFSAYDASGGWNPDWMGVPTYSQGNPQGEPACFPLASAIYPCQPPVFTQVPDPIVNWRSNCRYTFQFIANEGGNQPPANPVVYSKGGPYWCDCYIDSLGNLTAVRPDCGSYDHTSITVVANNSCGCPASYSFRINWAKNTPTVSGCPIGLQRVAVNHNYYHRFGFGDSTTCDHVVAKGISVIDGESHSDFHLDGAGLFVVNASPANLGDTLTYRAWAVGDCDSTGECIFRLAIIPPYTINIDNCPSVVHETWVDSTYTHDFNAVDPESCGTLLWSVTQDGGPPISGAFGIDSLGVFTFAPDSADAGDSLWFKVAVTDSCGGDGECRFCVPVIPLTPYLIKIEKTHNSLQGHYEVLSITKVQGSEKMGGYDFLLAYDATGLIFTSAEIGAALKPAGCGWEYFTYRFGAAGNCNGPCPSGFLRIVAIADINNGANHPSCFAVPDGGELASLKFYVTNDRTYDCQYVPVRFAWFDCGDNGISSQTGDTLFISKQVFDFENTNPLSDPLYEITGLDCGMDPHYGGYCYQSCLVGQKYFPVPFIRFWNGGVDIVCADSIDARGDLNLNGIANEIADAVLYTNYFLYGISAFDPLYFEGSIAASDVNADGRSLTVGDLVYLMRVIIGDALPYPKLAPFANSANVNVVNGVVSTEASTEVGAVYATFAVNGAYSVVNNSTMEVVNAVSNGELKVLVYSGMSNMTNRLAAGSNNLFTVTGNVELKSVEVADYNGNMLNTRVAKTALPTAFALSQNVPNPFNPTTKIGLSLPTVSDWSVDIYNVAGQLVKSFNGRGIGNVTADWDASNVASGIYFYKATAGSFTDTKKMMLLK